MQNFYCPTCHAEMEHRNGKFGGFWYCKQHGTISDKGVAILRSIQRTSEISTQYSGSNTSDLLDMVKRKGYELGHSTDDLGQLVDWINDPDPNDVEEDDDHWMNIRPY